jgi:hypothetical protein
VGVQQRLLLGRRVRDAPAALTYNGELTPHTFGVDQPDDAVLVGLGSAPEHLSCRCAPNISPVGVRIVMRPRIERPIGVLLESRQAVGSSRC